MTSWARSTVVVLGAATGILIGAAAAPAASASPSRVSPLSDLLDAVNSGSSGPPATADPDEGDFLIDLPGLALDATPYLSYRNVTCLIDPIYSPDALNREGSVLVQLIADSCDRNVSSARFELVLVDPRGPLRFGAVEARMRSGYVLLQCDDTARPGFVPLRCEAGDEMVTFS